MRVIRAVTLFAVICITTTASFAATLDWTGASDNRWNNAANWNPAQLPQTGDTLRFNTAPNMNTVNDLPAGTVLDTLLFNGGTYTVSGSTVEVSTRIFGNTSVSFSASIRAMGTLELSGITDATGTLDVNGRTVLLSIGNTFHGPVTGTGTLYNTNSVSRFYSDSPFSGTLRDFQSTACGSQTFLLANFPSTTLDVNCRLWATGTLGAVTSSAQFVPHGLSTATGIVTTGNLVMSNRGQSQDAAGPYRVNIQGTTPGSGYDQIKVNGTVTLQNGFLTLEPINGFTPSAGQSFVIIDNDGSDAVSGIFTQTCFGTFCPPYPEGSTITAGGSVFRISYHGGTGNDVVVSVVAPSTTTVVTSPNPSQYSRPVTMTATVTGSGPTPTGTVTFTVNGGAVGTAPLVNGQASFSISTIGGGTHVVRATYNGDSTYGTSTSAAVLQTVQAIQTTTTLTSSTNPSILGQNVTFTSTTMREQNFGPVADGTPIQFREGNAQIGTALTTNGVAVFTTSELTAGSHNINAYFEGTYFFQSISEASSTSNNVVQVVQTAPKATTTSATAAAVPVGTGGSVAITVASSGGTPTGSVTVSNGNTVLGSATLDGSGKATVSLAPLPAGTYTLTVSYGGGSGFSPSSTTVTLTVNSLTISGDDESIVEGNSGQSTVRVSVRLAFAATQTVTVNYATADGTATAGSDYVASSGTVTFAPGETRATISIPVNGDVAPEADERFVVRFSNAQNAQLQRSQLNVTILNDDDSFTVARDLEYANVAGTSFMLDLFLPVDGKLHPVIVGIDAADWNSPIRQTSIITREAGRGYAVAMLSFRPAATAQMPAQINDVKAAIRWLRANAARFGLDPSRIGAWGIGAGGHLAALLGTTNGEVSFDDPSLGNAAYPSTVTAVVDWYGATNLTSLATDPTVCGDTVAQITQLLGCSATSCPDKARAASASTFVTANDATFLIMHGSADCNVPIAQSRSLNDALHAAGVDSTLVVNESAGHGGAAWNNEALLQQVDAFFDSELMPLLPRVRRSQH